MVPSFSSNEDGFVADKPWCLAQATITKIKATS
jgi:hypothetical protein